MNVQILTRGGALLAAAAAVIMSAFSVGAQPTSTSPLAPPPNGPRRLEPASGYFALTNATIFVKPGTKLEGATLVVRDGLISDVIEAAPAGDGTKPAAKQPALPPSARVFDATGMTIYPGFIDPYIEVDVPRPDGNAPGAHWNPRITPQRSVLDRGTSGIDDKTGDTLRSLGFVAAGISPKGGLIRGTGAVVSLSRASADPSDSRPRVYADRAYQTISFDAQGDFGGDRPDDARWVRYPDSQMGAIALIRQTIIDADAQAREREAGTFKETTNALDALRPGLKVPLLVDSGDELESLRGLTIAKEFSRPAIVLGSGREYRRLAALGQFKTQYIVPLNYPQRPKVGSIGEAESVDLNTLIAWEQAPTNLRRLDAAGATVALTTSKVPDKLGGRGGFKDRLALAIKHGLPSDKALAMLTVNPAAILGVSGTLGTIEKGKVASFVIADGPLFADRPDAPKKGEDGYIKAGKVIDVWIDGMRHPIAHKDAFDLDGTWTLSFMPEEKTPSVKTLAIEENRTLTVVRETVEAGKKTRSTSTARDFSIDEDGRFSFVFDNDPFGEKGVFINTGMVERNDAGELVLHGTAVRTTGESLAWKAIRQPKPPESPSKKEYKPTLGAIAGTWTLVLKDGIAKPDDPQHPSVMIGADKSVNVKRADDELKVTDVTFDTRDEGAETLVNKIKYTVVGLTPDQASVRVTLTPGADRNRLSGSTKDDGGETFELARARLTPESDEIKDIPERLGLPVGPYAMKETPEQGSVLITNATVWTCAKGASGGIIENGFVAFQGGKITLVSNTMPSLQGEWLTIDAKGKHVTPGIIDCHSHTGISKGVNESGQAVTAEVRIGDVTDPDSVSWYRQLGGGVTSVSSLHGSANPIGGQNQVNKVRWGVVAPNDMHFEGAIAGIKFALGENVKQSNWGDRSTTRYPQTRMGVETLIRDRFTAASEYARAWSTYAAGAGAESIAGLPASFRSALAKFQPKGAWEKGSPAPRRDLELEALAEILGGTRLIHCHSYRQDEILMLTRIARDFGFRIGTFQHILEGYKVADAVRDYAIGGSSFSDWWNYKVEVQDAIPYSGPIMHEVGVVVSYNSDSDEMARRLNVEAGKAMKYGGKDMTPSEALKFVTLNPAKQLKIDDRVGSIEVGKDADLVIWSGPPMSSLSRAERTWVDGRLMFSLDRDAELRKANNTERQRIMQKILAQEKREKGGGSTSKTKTDEPPPPSEKPATPPSAQDDGLTEAIAEARASGRSLLRADALLRSRDLQREMFLSLLKRGMDPRWARMGECGCQTLNQNNGGAQ